MTLHVVCAVHDSAVGAYNRPFFAPALPAAVRSFVDEVNRAAADNLMYSHPDDYTLWILGQFDDVEGVFVTEEDGRRVVSRAKDVRSVKE